MTKIIPQGTDNFEFHLLPEIRGYFSSIDPTLAPRNVLIRGSQNVYKTSDQTIANRFGRKQYDTVDATQAGTKASFEWDTSLGKHYILRIANAKYQVLSDVTGTKVWYDLLTSLATTRGVWAPWWDNTNKKDKLIMVIGDLKSYDWSGGITTVDSGTINTITKQGTSTWAAEGFSPTGTVTISGVDYTYTGGTDTTTITGVGTDASGLTAGLVSIQKVVTNSNYPVSSPGTGFTNDFIRSINNQMYVGSYSSRFIYISSNTDYTSFTGTFGSTTRAPGGPELLILDNPGKGIGVRGSSLTGNAHIFAGTSDMYIVSFAAIAVGANTYEQTKVDKRDMGGLSAALGHEFIDSSGDTLIWLSQDQQVKTFGTYPNALQLQYPTISNEVSTDLVNETFTGGHLRIIGGGDKGDIIYLTAPNSGITYLYQVRTTVDVTGNVITERLWHSPFVWGVSRVGVTNGTVIGYSNSQPQVYELWDTGQWHDDGAGEGSVAITLPYTSIALMAYQNHGRRQGRMHFTSIYWEGYMTEGTSLYGAIYLDYQGASGILSPVIHSIIDNLPAPTSSFFSGVVPPSLGDASLGDNPLGDVTAVIMGSQSLRDSDLVPKFKIITDVQASDCFEYALMAFSSREDDRWALITAGTNAVASSFSATNIRK